MDLQIVRDIIQKAAQEIILPSLNRITNINFKHDGSVVTEVDLNTQKSIRLALQESYPDIGFMGEEMSQAQQLSMLDSKRFWCLDPLDGTGNYAATIPLFAVSLAMIEKGKPIYAWIYDPIRDECFMAQRGHGATLNEVKIHSSQEKTLQNAIGFIDFKRLNESQSRCFSAKKLYRSQRNIGTCALEWAWLAAGRGHFIAHGGQHLWDYAAGSLIAEEAGAVISDFKSQHPFHQLQLSSPILAGANPAIHQQLISSIQKQ
ncbi:MAG: inositol monophosphatase family protein [Mariprofundaceae bacterium]|nr:inositol monophosphatase family protein [Mariprofundaceae bacterium]